ncbi:hypothetical protein ACWCPD_25660 [Streptomyces sp. NPDC001935]
MPAEPVSPITVTFGTAASTITARDGLAVVPSANSRHIMAGAGTAALELSQG